VVQDKDAGTYWSPRHPRGTPELSYPEPQTLMNSPLLAHRSSCSARTYNTFCRIISISEHVGS